MLVTLPLERESKILRSGIIRLRRLGIVLFRRNIGGMRIKEEDGDARYIAYASPGQADTYGWEIRTGRHWEIEWKRPGRRPTPLQLQWLRDSSIYGAVAFWADNVNTAERVAEAVLAGGKIVWGDGDEFNVEMS